MIRAGSVLLLAFMSMAGITGGSAPNPTGAAGSEVNPFDRQVADQLRKLESASVNVRGGAAEALGYLRAYSVSDALVKALGDEAASVRREAALSLAWCGSRPAVEPLLAALGDDDWAVRQAACVSRSGAVSPWERLCGLSVTSCGHRPREPDMILGVSSPL